MTHFSELPTMIPQTNRDLVIGYQKQASRQHAQMLREKNDWIKDQMQRMCAYYYSLARSAGKVE